MIKSLNMFLRFGIDRNEMDKRLSRLELKKFDALLFVIEKNRNNNLENYGLCPSHYLSPTA